jgi:hypothetical protein
MPSAFSRLSPRENASYWQATKTLSAWLAEAWATVGAHSPPGLAWISHNLRQGGTSASERPSPSLWRGWAKSSDVTVGTYIDPLGRYGPVSINVTFLRMARPVPLAFMIIGCASLWLFLSGNRALVVNSRNDLNLEVCKTNCLVYGTLALAISVTISSGASHHAQLHTYLVLER